MITFVGAGPGAEDLITVRGQNLLKEADIVIYAGSLVNPGLLSMCRENCEIYNSAKMTLEEVMEVMTAGERAGKKLVRLHTGYPCLYGAIREQMDELEKLDIPYEVCPGVSSFCGAAAALDFVSIYCFIIGVNSATFVLLYYICILLSTQVNGQIFCGCIIAFLIIDFNCRKNRTS